MIEAKWIEKSSGLWEKEYIRNILKAVISYDSDNYWFGYLIGFEVIPTSYSWMDDNGNIQTDKFRLQGELERIKSECDRMASAVISNIRNGFY